MIGFELLASAAGVLASLVGYLFASSRKEALESRAEAYRELLSDEIREIQVSFGPVSYRRRLGEPEVTEDALEDLKSELLERLITSKRTESEVTSEVREELESVLDRIENIESRYPPEAELEKLSSINDAILSERLQQLAKRIDELEDQVLTRWDVVKAVSAMIGAIFTVVGATVGVVQYFG